MKWLFALIPAALAASIPNVNLGEAPPPGQVNIPLQNLIILVWQGQHLELLQANVFLHQDLSSGANLPFQKLY
jgi:hypothetical protein